MNINNNINLLIIKNNLNNNINLIKALISSLIEDRIL